MFKDDIKNDLPVFVDVEEFAEMTDIDGVICRAQVMSHSAEKSARLTESFAMLEGDFTEVFFLSAPYIKKRHRLPRHGEWCYINAVRYDVEACTDEMGICHLILSAYRQHRGRFK